MRYLLVVGLGALVLAACSSTTEGDGGGGCADISGNWQFTSTKTSGACPKMSSDESSSNITMRKDADGVWNAVLPGLSGSCPGELNASTCKFIANCDFTSNGKIVASVGVEWVFSKTSFTGTEIGTYLPPTVATKCVNSYQDTGKKL